MMSLVCDAVPSGSGAFQMLTFFCCRHWRLLKGKCLYRSIHVCTSISWSFYRMTLTTYHKKVFSKSSLFPHIDHLVKICSVTFSLLSPAAPEARDGRYCNAPVRLSVCLSVCPSRFSFRTVTQKRIPVFSRNFAGTCTKSWGCAV